MADEATYGEKMYADNVPDWLKTRLKGKAGRLRIFEYTFPQFRIALTSEHDDFHRRRHPCSNPIGLS